MRRNWKFGMACLLAGVMFTSNVSAQAAKNADSQSQTQSVQNVTHKSGNLKVSDYIEEGEVLILYGDKNKKVSALSANSLGKDMVVEDTVVFDCEDVAGAKSTGAKGSIYVSKVKSENLSVAEMIKILKQKKDIVAVQPNIKLHATGTDYSSFQWALDNDGQNGGTVGMDMNPEVAIAEDSKDKKEKVIAIVDTGVDYTHPDLATKMWNNPYSSLKLKGKHGYDFVNYDADPADDNGHGTHCAGIAAATVDGSGVSGVSDSDNIKVMAIKFLNEQGGGNLSDAVNAYNYIYRAQKLGTNIVAINNSWGATLPEDVLAMLGMTLDDVIPERDIMQQLIDMVGEMGAVSCIAAGNDGIDTAEAYVYPANLSSPYKVTVAACNEDGELATFSNFNSEKVDLAAPGVNILSTVCYDRFNPTIYTDEKAAELCSYLNRFEDEDSLDFIDESAVLKSKNTKKNISLTEDYHYGVGEKALSIQFSDVKDYERNIVAIPIDVPSGTGDCYASVDAKMISDGLESECSVDVQYLTKDDKLEDLTHPDETYMGNGNYWVHKNITLYGETADSQEDTDAEEAADAEEEGQYYLIVDYSDSGATEGEILIDNFGISKRVEDTSVFEKYDIYNGTSMATPYVAGAVAQLSQVYPKMTSLEKKNLMLSCCRKTEGLMDACKSNGMLDLGMIENPSMNCSEIALDEKKNIVITGSYLNGATVYIDDAEVALSSKSEECLVVPYKGAKNKTVTVLVVKGEDTFMQDIFIPSADLMKTVNMGQSEEYLDSFVADAQNMYTVGGNGAALKKLKDTKDGIVQEEVVGKCEPSVFGSDFETILDCYISMDSDIVVCNDKFYGIMNIMTAFCEESILAVATPNGSWEKLADLPVEYAELRGVTIAAYNSNIYLIGGINQKDESFSKEVFVCDTTTGKWSKAAAMPEGRAASKAIQVGSKLVVTLGAMDKKGTFPKNMIFDGKKWTVGKKSISCNPNGYMWYGQPEETDEEMADQEINENSDVNPEGDSENEEFEFAYYDAEIALVNGGIAYQGILSEELGNMMVYDVAKDTFSSAGYASPSLIDMECGMAVCNDKLVLYSINYVNNVITKYEAAQKNGYVTATVKADNATVTGNKAWLPCDRIEISAAPKKDCYIEAMTVNGKAITPDAKKIYSFCANAGDYAGGLTIDVKATPYVTALQLDEKIDLLPGSEAQLIAIVLPDTIKNAKLTWESSDKTVATVDANGLVKVPASAKAGSVATITVTASDRGTVKATCKVNVTQKVAEVPAKGTKKTIGKFVYKVTKSDKTSGTVSVVKMTNKNYTKLSIPATVKIDGYTFKVTSIAANAFKSSKKLTTVTIGKNITSIGKNAFKSSKKLKKVTIKATKIKTIGKGAFTSVNKKCTISVPKKQKTSYKKLLQKSGYKYKIK